MKDVNKVVEEAVEHAIHEATKPNFFTPKRLIIGAVVAAAVAGVVVVIKTVKKSHDSQELDLPEVVESARNAAKLDLAGQIEASKKR